MVARVAIAHIQRAAKRVIGTMASCAVGRTYAGGRWCYPVLGTKEDLAKREALARCGGPTDCILLYLGQQMQGNFEIVVQ